MGKPHIVKVFDVSQALNRFYRQRINRGMEGINSEKNGKTDSRKGIDSGKKYVMDYGKETTESRKKDGTDSEKETTDSGQKDDTDNNQGQNKRGGVSSNTPERIKTMKDEMQYMAQNDVWELVELLEGFKSVGCK